MTANADTGVSWPERAVPSALPLGRLRGGTLSEMEHFRQVVESSDDAIVSKDLDGTIKTWNRAAERLFGYSASEIIGKSILTIIPADRRGEEADIIARIRRGERVEHYETVRQRKDGSLVDLSLTVSPILDRNGEPIGASKIARDITERKTNEILLKKQTARLATLNRVAKILSRDLNLERIAQAVTDIATELSGGSSGAFFYNAVDETRGETLLCNFSGAERDSREGVATIRDTALFEATFREAAIIRSDDIREDPRCGKDVPIASYLAVPVVSVSGHVLGGLFFGHELAGTFQEETVGLVVAVASQAAFAIDNARLHRASEVEIERRCRTERANDLLVNEIKHRVKNTLGTVQAMATQTFRKAPAEERNLFVGRIHALADAHDVLTQRNWGNVSLNELTTRVLHPFVDAKQKRLSAEGPDLEISPNRALLLAMVLHEMGTNAIKFGSLSNDTGTVDVAWDVVHGPDGRRVKLVWTERGGPPVAPPERKGFGSRMIEHAIRGEQGISEFVFDPEGLICRIDMPV